MLNGILRAAGRQALGATLHAVVMWGVGLPVAYLLAFRLRWGVVGEGLQPGPGMGGRGGCSTAQGPE